MQLWFRALARKSSSGQKTRSPSRTARRPSVSLRLEPVEDRTLASAVNLDPLTPTLPLPETGDAVESRPISELPPGEKVPVLDENTGLIEAETGIFDSGQGISDDAGLIDDGSASADVIGPADVPDSAAAPGLDAPALEESLAQGFVPLVRGQKLTPSISPAFGPAVPSSAPSDAVFSLDVTRVETPAPESAQPQESPPRPANEPAGAGLAASDTTRAATDRAATASTSHPAATGPSAKPPAGTTDDRVATRQDARPRRATSTAQPVHENPDRPGTRADRAASLRNSNRPADSSVSRTDVHRLSADVPDGSLLHRFVTNREQEAFTALVRRHERFVLNVCQRVLGDSHAAQDAFQTTFLVLARKASMLDRQGPLSGWLYKVAYHAALRLRVVAMRQRLTEAEAAMESSTGTECDSSMEVETLEMRQAVQEELQRLPEKYRAPLVLCYVDGRTHDDAAREIGLPRGSMAKRIGEGLERLRERLINRGFTL